MNTIRVAIDGPSGAGKSTLARSAAKKLGFWYVDTGAIYRTIGLYVYRKRAFPGMGRQWRRFFRKFMLRCATMRKADRKCT